MKHSEKIAKLNVLEKLVNQTFVTVKSSLGESAIVEEINSDIKNFITGRIAELLGDNAPSSIGFSDEEVIVLKEMASKLLQKAGRTQAVAVDNSGGESDVIVDVANGSIEPRVKKSSPVLEALNAIKFDKNASPEERAAKIKELERTQRKGS